MNTSRRLLLFFFVTLFFCTILFGCTKSEKIHISEGKIRVGLMLSDVGLGDRSFSDSAFLGLVKAREELDIIFDYRELQETKTYEKGLTELVEAGNSLVVGIGYKMQEDLEKVAKKYPNQQFILIDAESKQSNIISVTFREEQGSYLAGVVAALTTNTNKVGVIGGQDIPIIHRFTEGFEKGARSINPDIEVDVSFAGDFGNEKLGAKLAKLKIDEGYDVLYAPAGLTGVGVLTEAQANGVYAIGVDSDQYFFAEKAVITSMTKKVDIALYQIIEHHIKNGAIKNEHKQLGIKEGGVGLAPIRIINWSSENEEILNESEIKLKNGEISIEMKGETNDDQEETST